MTPLIVQDWGKLAFMHWPVPVENLRALVPRGLEIDTFDGTAWLGLVPFTMWGIRHPWLPPIPGTSAFHEFNVRTYVRHPCGPGVWFFSLDAANRLAVWGARRLYGLPYYFAEMELRAERGAICYRSARKENPAMKFEARWRPGEPLPPSQPGSLEYFLTERYRLYTGDDGRLGTATIEHVPWPLRSATLEALETDAGTPYGLDMKKPPHLLYAEHLHVAVAPHTWI